MSRPRSRALPAVLHPPRPAALVGYTAGVFDLFNVGHLNLLREARARCDFLAVGVSTDDLVEQTKGIRPYIPQLERTAIVGSIRYVDAVVPQLSMDKVMAWNALHFDLLFVGDAALGDPYWTTVEHDLEQVGAAVLFLPATYVEGGALLDRRPADEQWAERLS